MKDSISEEHKAESATETQARQNKGIPASSFILYFHAFSETFSTVCWLSFDIEAYLHFSSTKKQ